MGRQSIYLNPIIPYLGRKINRKKQKIVFFSKKAILVKVLELFMQYTEYKEAAEKHLVVCQKMVYDYLSPLAMLMAVECDVRYACGVVDLYLKNDLGNEEFKKMDESLRACSKDVAEVIKSVKPNDYDKANALCKRKDALFEQIKRLKIQINEDDIEQRKRNLQCVMLDTYYLMGYVFECCYVYALYFYNNWEHSNIDDYVDVDFTNETNCIFKSFDKKKFDNAKKGKPPREQHKLDELYKKIMGRDQNLCYINSHRFMGIVKYFEREYDSLEKKQSIPLLSRGVQGLSEQCQKLISNWTVDLRYVTGNDWYRKLKIRDDDLEKCLTEECIASLVKTGFDFFEGLKEMTPKTKRKSMNSDEAT